MGALSNISTAVAAPPRPERGWLGDLWTVVLAVAIVVAELVLLVVIWEPAHWQPISLVAVLTAFMVLGEVDAVRIGRVYVSSTACASVLAMALLGPVPAAVIAATGCIADWLVNRKAAWAGLSNTTNSSLAVLAGALLIETAAGEAAGGRLALVVFASGILNAAVNLALLAAVRRIRLGASFRHDFAATFLPTIPYHLLGIVLATAAAQIVVAGDFPLLAAVIPALVMSEFLLRSLAAEHARAEEVISLTTDRANLLDQALNAEVGEREWIAGHLHDGTLQTLAVTRQDIEEVIDGDPAAARSARDHLDHAVAELRSTLVHVHPGSVGDHGLGPTLDVFAGQVFRNGTSWSIGVEPRAGEMHQALLYSLARELLGNAAKHARAQRVDLRISLDGDLVRLTVTDDGVGFRSAPFGTHGHFGLLTARNRVAAAGGTLTVSSEPGAGSTIVAQLPARVPDQRSR